MPLNHTPGPWKVDYNCTSLVYSDKPRGEAEIAHVDDFDDAHLISLAPELLESIRGLVGYMRTFEIEDPEWPIDVLRDAEALLARADAGPRP